MAVTIPNPTLSGAVSSTDLDANFAALANKFGNITNADVASGAAIDINKLSAQYERLLVPLRCYNNGGTTVTVSGRSGASLSALAAGTRLDTVPLPGDSSDTNWEIYDVSWVCTDTGNNATKVRIEWGYYDGTGTWTVSTTPVAAWTLANAAANDDANDGQQVNSTSTTLDFNHGSTNTPRSLALVLDTQGANTLSAAGSLLAVSVLLRRKIQAS